MPSSVCQGLQFCLEPRVVGPRVLMLKLAPPKPHSSCSFGLGLPNRFDFGSSHEQPQQFPPHKDAAPATTDTNTDHMDLDSWKFFRGIVKTNHYYCNDNNTYIHPPVKHSSSSLSQESLEMCTESLGNETGSDYSEEIYLKSPDIKRTITPTNDQQLKLKGEAFSTKKPSRGKCFPPPLSSISRLGGFQVRSHREGGRLIMWAVSVPSYHRHFHVKRSDGRLRLGLLKDECQLAEPEMVLQEREDENNGCIPESELNDDINVSVDKITGCNISEEELEEDGEQDGEDIFESEENRGSGFTGGESGRREFSSKTRRCNASGQGNKGLLKWKPFLLAT